MLRRRWGSPLAWGKSEVQLSAAARGTASVEFFADGGVCCASRSPELGTRRRPSVSALGERYELVARAPALEISQAAAGVGARPVPGAASHNHLSREDSLAACKTLGIPKASASSSAAGEVHCCVKRAPQSPYASLTPRSSFADAARHKCALLARLLSQGQITGATETTRDQNKQDGRLLVPGQLAPHVALSTTKKSTFDRQRLSIKLAPRVDAPARQ